MAAAAMMAYQAVFLIPILGVYCLAVSPPRQGAVDRAGHAAARLGRLAALHAPHHRHHAGGQTRRLLRSLRLPGDRAQAEERADARHPQRLDRLPRPGSRRGDAGLAPAPRAGYAVPAGVDRPLLRRRRRAVFRRLGALPAADGGAGLHPRLAPAGPNGWPRPSPRNSRSRWRWPPSTTSTGTATGRFAAALRAPSAGHRVWVDNDWGLRYYLEADHALPARKGQHVRPDDIVVSSELGHNVEFNAPLALLTSETIQSAIPLRLIGLNSHSGYSTVEEGFLPFGISTRPDRPRAGARRQRAPRHRGVSDDPFARRRGADRRRHRCLRRLDVQVRLGGAQAHPRRPKKLRAEFYIPPNAKAREVTLLLDGREVARAHLSGPRTVQPRNRPNHCKARAWRSGWTRPSPLPATSAHSAWC